MIVTRLFEVKEPIQMAQKREKTYMPGKICDKHKRENDHGISLVGKMEKGRESGERDRERKRR